MTFGREWWLVVQKDLRGESRQLEGMASMLFLAVVAALVLALALGTDGQTTPAQGIGVLWVASLLAATIGLGRLWQRERQWGGFRGLLLTALSRSALFLGKSTAFFLSLLVVELVLVPVAGVLFHLPIWGPSCWLVCLVVALGCWGFSLLGILLGAVGSRARAGELLLGAVMYPLVVPVVVGGVRGTTVVLEGGGLVDLQPWLGLLLVADAIFLVAGLWLFESLVSE